MPASPGGSERHTTTGVLAVGAATLAIFCCLGLPLVVSLVGGLTLAGVVGLSVGALIAVAVVAAAVMLLRSHRGRADPPSTTDLKREAKR